MEKWSKIGVAEGLLEAFLTVEIVVFFRFILSGCFHLFRLSRRCSEVSAGVQQVKDQ